MSRKIAALTLLAVAFLGACCREKKDQAWLIGAPAGDAYTRIDRKGTTVIPNGRLLTPRGRQVIVAPHPYGLTLSPDGTTAVTANSGQQPFSLSVIRNVLDAEPSVTQIPPGVDGDEGVLAAVFMGLAAAPDNRTLYAGGGQEGKILIVDLDQSEKLEEIDCNGRSGEQTFVDSYIGDLVLDSARGFLYAVDQANFRVVVIDTKQGVLVSSIPVGRYPFGIALSPDKSRLYVANVGMFAYSLIQPPQGAERPGLLFPPFAFGSREAREGTEIEGYKVPGLGDPNVPESFSVWEVDVRNALKARVTAKVKTGILVGEMVEGIPAVGGSSPNSVAASADRVYVSNGNNDSVSVIDAEKDKVVATISLQLDPRLGRLKGVIPFGLALSPDGRRLYVAEAGVNAVAVIDTRTNAVLGHIPVGWFPSKLAVTPDGRHLCVANAKGFGSGPNGGRDFQKGPEGTYVGNLMKGTVSILPIPDDAAFRYESKRVLDNNFLFAEAPAADSARRLANPVPLLPGTKTSPIKHIVFVVKENRTFDEVFGARPGAKGDPSLARYGAGVTFSNRDKTRTVENATVMANHLALADRFAVADNFYCDSDVSADGHRWLQGVYPNEWVETSVPASYGDQRLMKPESPAPGMRAFTESSAAVIPEDYNEAGSIWDHFQRHRVRYFNFGLGINFFTTIEERQFKNIGQLYIINYPVPGNLLENTSRLFPTWNMGIPDQFRVDMFIREFADRWAAGDRTLPSMLTVYLPNDHGTRERPEEGYPFRESYMGDNDLALGRLVEFLSHTRYWKDMAIFVTEDDPQNGQDHIDAHRSLMMVISPYAKPGYVGHQHYSFGSLMKTFWHILGLPYLNQYDAGATDLADMFRSEPDLSPYRALPADGRIFDPVKALDPLDEKFNWKALKESPKLDDPDTIRRWMREQETKEK